MLDGANAHAQCIKSMRSFSVSRPFEWRASDGRGEYGEKAMKGDEGSGETSSLYPQ